MTATLLIIITILSWVAVFGLKMWAREADRGLDSIGGVTALYFLMGLVAILITIYTTGHIIYLLAVS